jgi:hypothetical protein
MGWQRLQVLWNSSEDSKNNRSLLQTDGTKVTIQKTLIMKECLVVVCNFDNNEGLNRYIYKNIIILYFFFRLRLS